MFVGVFRLTVNTPVGSGGKETLLVKGTASIRVVVVVAVTAVMAVEGMTAGMSEALFDKLARSDTDTTFTYGYAEG